MIGFIGRMVAMVLLCLAASGAGAQDQATAQRLWEAATKAMTSGPELVPFTDQAVLRLPDGMAYIPAKESSALMKSWGNATGDGFRGLIISVRDEARWVVSIDQIADGFVKDDDAKNWNADDLLQALKDGTEAQNQERIKAGIPALDIVGWVQPPRYDASMHRLVWSLKAVDRGSAADDEAIVNYNTYALGRDGYFEINLMTGASTVDRDKPMVHSVLNGFIYNQGKRYEDFVEGTDHVAEYGIAALIAGVAAKKLGLLAVIGVFLAKFAKIILVALAVAGGVFAKFFRRNNQA